MGRGSSGIGGGGFMLVRGPNGALENVDFREKAPALATEDMYTDNVLTSIFTGLASGVPGELRGLEYLHCKYGQLPWASLVKPSICLARDGWEVNEDLVTYMNSVTAYTDNFLVDESTWAEDFAPNGTRLGLGDVITRKRYATTLEAIAEGGADAFYHDGPIARATIETVQNNSGIMTMSDLEDYAIELREPLMVDYRGYRVASTSAPSSGAVVLSVLNTISGYDEMGDAEMRNISTHRLDEAMRFGYGQRTELGDPSFVDGMSKYQAQMLDPSTGEESRSLISDDTTLPVESYDPSGFESLETPGTSAITVVDANGLAVALTSTINLIFGSHVMVPETGVILNNEMNDFSIPGSSNAFGYIPSPANYIVPGKRPLSSISPTIVERPDGMLHFVIAAAGGSRIISSIAQILWQVLDLSTPFADAMAEPRFHDQLVPDETTFEEDFDEGTVAFMASRNHNISYVASGLSSVQCVGLSANGSFEPVGEPRQTNSGGFVA